MKITLTGEKSLEKLLSKVNNLSSSLFFNCGGGRIFFHEFIRVIRIFLRRMTIISIVIESIETKFDDRI